MFKAPAEGERLEILTNLLEKTSLAPDVALKSLATQTAALVAADLVDLVHRAKYASIQRTIASSYVKLARSYSLRNLTASRPLAQK